MVTNIRRDFEGYLRFEVSLAELRTRLGPSGHFEREGHSFELSGDVTVGVPIDVDSEHVVNAINLVLQNRIAPGAVEEWANLLLLSDVYAIAPRRDEPRRETLLQCIHELASPSVFGDFDTEHLLDLRRRSQNNVDS